MNLLPQNKKDEINKGYKMRILITAFWAAFFTMIACSAIFLPDYIIIRSKLSEIRERKEANAKTAKDQTDTVNASRLINQKIALASQGLQLISAADRFARLGGILQSGVTINKVLYGAQKIILSGVAEKRDSLAAFKKEIDKIDFVKETSVPVSDFAKDKNLTFTLTIHIKDENE